MKTLTNILNYQIYKSNIDADFCVVEFVNGSTERNIDSRLLDDPDINFISFSYAYGRKAYALMDKEAYEDLRFSSVLDKFNICYRKLDVNTCYDEIILKLFLNALSNYRSDHAYNNLTGKFFRFIELEGKTIKAFEFEIKKKEKELLLQVHATSFKKEITPDFRKPVYKMDGNHKSLQRVFEKSEGDLYVREGVKGKKTTSKFVSLKDKSGRAKEMIDVVDLINRRFNNYISLSFKEVESKYDVETKGIKLDVKTLELIKKYTINVFDYVLDDAYSDSVIDFIELMKNEGIDVSSNHGLLKEKLNIVLIHDKEYYESKNIKDPHQLLDKDCVHQCIVIDRLDEMMTNSEKKLSPQIVTIFKELLIKNDIVKKKSSFSYDDWIRYGFKKAYKFFFKDKTTSSICSIVIEPDGNYNISYESSDLFNYEVIETLNNKELNVEFIVVDDNENVNAVIRTDIVTMPYPKVFENEKISKSKASMEEFYPGLCDIHYYKIADQFYYNVGTTLSNIQFDIKNASHFYEIKCINNSNCIVPDLLRLMSVRFVRYNESTVLPYPVKYLREYVEINKNSNNTII